jgi:hypothetical protein
MTGGVFSPRQRVLLLAAVLVTLAGGLGLAFLLIDRQAHRADLAVAEANLRGGAVSTLAGDVRALRAQVEAHGGTPVAPDPSKAVPSLSARAEVPVPIPGPRGATGATGREGPTGPAGSPGSPGSAGSPGKDGASGQPGIPGPTGPPGVQGEPGPAGADGTDGRDGSDGQPPAGWSYAWTDSAGVTHHVSCSRTAGSSDDAPQYDCADTSTDSPSPTPSAPVDPQGALLLAAAALKRRRTHAGAETSAEGSRTRGRHRAGGAHR